MFLQMNEIEKKNYCTTLTTRCWFEKIVKANQDVNNTSKLVVDTISMEATENAIVYLDAVKAYMKVFLYVKNTAYKYGVTSFMVGRIVRRSTRAYMIVESALKEYIIAGGDVEVISKANAFAEAVKAFTELESRLYEALNEFKMLFLNEDKALAEWKEKNEEAKTYKEKADETKADEINQINKKQKRP